MRWLDGVLERFKMGAGHQEDQAMIGSLELPAPSSIFQEGQREGLEPEVKGDHAYVMKPP